MPNARRQLHRSVFASCLDDSSIDEVIVHHGSEVWIDRAGKLSLSGSIEPHELQLFLEQRLAEAGRHLDRLTPMVDARLADGSRICAVIPPVAVDGIELSIRRHGRQQLDFEQFTTPPIADIIEQLVDDRHNIIVSGPTSAGKTSFLSALLAHSLTQGDRIIAIGDTSELQPSNDTGAGHLVHLEARQRSTDHSAEVTLHDLLLAALRLRPDRIVVGEVRGNEVVTLVQAMNTGHDGSMSTCHANSPHDAVHRLSQLMLQHSPNWPLTSIVDQLHRSIDVVVHLRRASGGRRVVADISQPTASGLVQVVSAGQVIGPLLNRGERFV